MRRARPTRMYVTNRGFSWRAWVSAVACAGLAVLGSACAAPPNARPQQQPRTARVLAGDGVVVGRIDACNAIAIGGRRGFVPGTVIALHGVMTLVPESGGVTRSILPTVRAGSQTVTKRERYRFVLSAGAYVLAARYPAGGNIEPSVSVSVGSGVETLQNIPNECI